MRSVLLLDGNYTPIGIIPWKRAVSLVIGRGKAHVLEEYQEKRSRVFNAAVIRLLVQSPNPYALLKSLKFSKRNIFLRDGNTCQYCGKSYSPTILTIDHVIPKSAGGPTTYLNCVTACKPCNAWKDSLSLEQAGMRLLKPIRKPELKDIFYLKELPVEWELYVSSWK